MPPSNTCPGYIIKPVCWQQAGASLMYVRRTVFMQEQQVPESLEWDGLDEEAHHLPVSYTHLTLPTNREV